MPPAASMCNSSHSFPARVTYTRRDHWVSVGNNLYIKACVNCNREATLPHGLIDDAVSYKIIGSDGSVAGLSISTLPEDFIGASKPRTVVQHIRTVREWNKRSKSPETYFPWNRFCTFSSEELESRLSPNFVFSLILKKTDEIVF